VRVAMEINIEGKCGKLKIRWLDRIEDDIKIAGVNKREGWQSTVKV